MAPEHLNYVNLRWMKMLWIEPGLDCFRYTSKMLLSAINEKHKGAYDFLYLPIDFKVIFLPWQGKLMIHDCLLLLISILLLSFFSCFLRISAT